jgi:hypothetical protein
MKSYRIRNLEETKSKELILKMKHRRIIAMTWQEVNE